MKALLGKKIALLSTVAVVFFFVANYLNVTTPFVFNSPDETMHYHFAAHVAETGDLAIAHTQDFGENGRFIFPRSTYSDGERILPVGFWGLNLLYGAVGALTGAAAIIFFTSLLALVGAYALYYLLKKIFDARIAFVSSILMLAHPVFLYYTSRSMFPNVPFVSLLLIGAASLLVRPIKTSPILNDVLGAISIFAALLIRPSEVWWVALVVLVGFVASKRQALRIGSVFALFGAAVAFLYMTMNGHLYGGGLSSYTVSESHQLSQWYDIFFPFGFDPIQSAKAGYRYFVQLFWWLTIPAGVGLVWYLYDWARGKLERIQKMYIGIFLFVSAYLFIFYGSFVDIRFELGTIGIAYTRYWLPIFIMSLPFWARIAIALNGSIKQRNLRWAMGFFIASVVACANLTLVYRGIDGLLATKANILKGATQFEQMEPVFDEQSIVITNTEDKFFWPQVPVMVNIKNADISGAAADFVGEGRRVFFYSPTLGDAGWQDISDHLSDFDLRLRTEQVFEAHTLYELVSIDQ